MKEKKSLKFILFISAIVFVITIFCIFIFILRDDAGAMRDASRHRTTAINGSVTLNDSDFTLIVPENINRDAFVICNIHPAIDVFLNFRSIGDSVDETGICLRAGECLTMVELIYTGPITAIATANDAKVTYLSF